MSKSMQEVPRGSDQPQYIFRLRRPQRGVKPEEFQLFSVVHGKKKEKLILGRHGSECDIFIFVEEQPNFLSRRHACIHVDCTIQNKKSPAYSFAIEDSQSVNGIYVNGTCLESDRRHILRHGDCVVLGNPNHSFFIEYEFVVVHHGSPLHRTLTLEALRLAKWKPKFNRRAALLCKQRLRSSRSLRVAKRRRTCFQMMELDNDTCTHILKFLSLRETVRMRIVCKAFDNITKCILRQVRTVRWCYGMGGVLSECKNLSAIDSSGCFLMCDNNLKLIASQCGETLTQLNLNGCPSISFKGLRRIADQCRNLEVLRLRGCKRAAPSSNWSWLLTLVRHNPKLRVLDLRGCSLTDSALNEVAMYCKNLEEAHIGVLPHSVISDKSLVALANSRSRRLKYIDLCGCNLIRDRGLIALITKHKATLESLGLQCCGIGDASLAALGRLECKLKRLNLHRCSQVTTKGIIRVVRGCGSTLEALDLSNCSISDKALVEIGKHAKNLRQIDLRSCKRITSSGIRSLVEGCLLLEEIDLDSCSRLCDKALDAIVLHSKHVRQIELERCHNFTEEAKAALRRALPNAVNISTPLASVNQHSAATASMNELRRRIKVYS